jgi:glycine dehydrogenase subunit 1
MPFIPHTDDEVAEMLGAIGADSIEALFDEIPNELRNEDLSQVPVGCSEMDMLAKLGARAGQDEVGPCFIGAGCYDHHVPAAVWDVAQRGEFLTAYTPYQAEASQGTLQLIYEFQSMMTALTGMDVSNASVYDGASGLAEAILMAVRANKKNKSRRVLVPQTLHPLYARTAGAIVRNQDIELVTVPMTEAGLIDRAALAAVDEAPVALVVPQPNFFGLLDDVDHLTEWAAERGTLVIGVVNPLALAILKPPSQWGRSGADIVCGDGQPLGLPMASGGPSFGFICCRQSMVRQMPGRIIGRTTDLDGKSGYTLTLQAREQHIRRAKATSNICTNQGLLVTAATIYMSLLGSEGLARVARRCHARAAELAAAVTRLDGVGLRFDGVSFHERVIELPKPAAAVAEAMAERGILAGLPLGEFHPTLDHCLLVCVTEKRSNAELAAYAATLEAVLRGTPSRGGL